MRWGDGYEQGVHEQGGYARWSPPDNGEIGHGDRLLVEYRTDYLCSALDLGTEHAPFYR